MTHATDDAVHAADPAAGMSDAPDPGDDARGRMRAEVDPR